MKRKHGVLTALSVKRSSSPLQSALFLQLFLRKPLPMQLLLFSMLFREFSISGTWCRCSLLWLGSWLPPGLRCGHSGGNSYSKDGGGDKRAPRRPVTQPGGAKTESNEKSTLLVAHTHASSKGKRNPAEGLFVIWTMISIMGNQDFS